MVCTVGTFVPSSVDVEMSNSWGFLLLVVCVCYVCVCVCHGYVCMYVCVLERRQRS